MKPERRLTPAQAHNVYLASVLAVRAGREILETADAQVFEVGPIADTLFRALALLGVAFPDDPCWVDPERRAADPIRPMPGSGHA